MAFILPYTLGGDPITKVIGGIKHPVLCGKANGCKKPTISCAGKCARDELTKRVVESSLEGNFKRHKPHGKSINAGNAAFRSAFFKKFETPCINMNQGACSRGSNCGGW